MNINHYGWVIAALLFGLEFGQFIGNISFRNETAAAGGFHVPASGKNYRCSEFKDTP